MNGKSQNKVEAQFLCFSKKSSSQKRKKITFIFLLGNIMLVPLYFEGVETKEQVILFFRCFFYFKEMHVPCHIDYLSNICKVETESSPSKFKNEGMVNVFVISHEKEKKRS